MEHYLVVLEPSKTGYAAFSPEVPGCVATGRSVEETVSEMRAALAFHFEGITESGESLPEPKGLEHYVRSGGAHRRSRRPAHDDSGRAAMPRAFSVEFCRLMGGERMVSSAGGRSRGYATGAVAATFSHSPVACSNSSATVINSRFSSNALPGDAE